MCHDQISVTQPPTTGPIVGASTASTPAMVVASPCRFTGNSRNTAENTAGISEPPEKPCTTRQKIRLSKPVLAAHPAEGVAGALVLLLAQVGPQREVGQEVAGRVAEARVQGIEFARRRSVGAQFIDARVFLRGKGSEHREKRDGDGEDD